MKKYLPFLFLLVLAACAKEKSQTPCNAVGGTFVGDVLLENQSQVDSFACFEYTKIVGLLDIKGQSITDLSGLSSLVNIEGGGLRIENSPISSLMGLHNLETIIGDTSENALFPPFFLLISLPNLSNLNDLQNLNTIIVNYYWVHGLPNLVSLQGNNNCSLFVKYHVEFQNCPKLELGPNLYQNIIDEIVIVNSGNQNSILDFLSVIDSITFDLQINNNENLTNLDVFSNLSFCNYISMRDNPSLTDFCGLENVVVPNHINLENNLYNPLWENGVFIDNCSQ